MLHLACRHHVYECHIKNVAKIFRSSCGPDHPLFKKLSESFSLIQFESQQYNKFEYKQNDFLDDAAEDSLYVCKKLLESEKLSRGDYKELAELVIFYLSPNQAQLKIKQPGAVHHARFMSQAIYYLKLMIVGSLVNFNLTAAEKREIKAMAEFIALFYAKWFLTAAMTVSSSRNDLKAIWEMKVYAQYRPDIANKCLHSMFNHGWYLHSSLIPLSLLDDKVPEDEKSEIALKILQLDFDTPLSNSYEKPNISWMMTKDDKPKLAQFVDSQSILLFVTLGHSRERLEWMKLPPHMWHLMSAFEEFKQFASTLPSVNDAAERNIKLLQDFIADSTDENLRQDLFLAIEESRKRGRAKSHTGE